MSDLPALPPTVRSRRIAAVNGLTMHVLEAGFDAGPRPVVLLLHGFPELAYSWRKVLPALADAGFHAIAPDQRGYGRTTGWDGAYDGDLGSYHFFNLVRDQLALLSALGIQQVHAVVGHDFGSPVAAWCAVTRPDVFKSVALMSAPFGGVPSWPTESTAMPALSALHDQLAALTPPRLHYQRFYATREADADMRSGPQGLHAFLRAYYHVKSADWPGNRIDPLAAMTAAELAKLPEYYVMQADRGMAATVAPHMPSPQQVAACAWLPEAELAVYAGEFGRTGFQGGLQWYRSAGHPAHQAQLLLYAGRRIDVPACFIAGASDWGVYQRPGDFEAMQATACADLRGCHLVPGAGHWVQQEQPEALNRLLIEFLGSV
ncbi:alpha/beta hydrolase [Caenimonas sedimenti]|uniref:Alpha/beta hydrolase n=1 Tax=Caenimonas sedimenti TaxID=2596921 RepID=A0A562ZH64_9BURK|nr:alpha/beta hydrolase [Caenimonas sedimenti]TWO67727.1 alpha/beta hydrolase [Caenimonas sedimenti]